MKSYQRAVDSNFYNHHLFVLILILYTSFSFSQSISSYNRALIDTEEKLKSMKGDPLGLIPSLIGHLEANPDGTFDKYNKMIARDKNGKIITEKGPNGEDRIKKYDIPNWREFVKLNHFTQIMVIDGIEYNLYSIFHAHEIFYPGLFAEVLEKDVKSIRTNHHYKLAIQESIDKAIKKKRRSLGYNDHDKITDEKILVELQEIEEKTRAAAIAKVEEVLSKDKKKKVKWAALSLAQKVEIRFCALLKQEHSRNYGKLVYRTLCEKGHELNEFLKSEINSYLDKRMVLKARASHFRESIPAYVEELNSDIDVLNGRCKGIKKGYQDLVDMDMTEYAKSVEEAGYPHPYEGSLISSTGSGSNYSSSTGYNTDKKTQDPKPTAYQKDQGLVAERNKKIANYFGMQEQEILGLLNVVKRHKLIYLYFSQSFMDAMGVFNLDACMQEGKGLNRIDKYDVKKAAHEILYDNLHHQLIKFLGLYEDLKEQQGKAYPDHSTVTEAMKKMIRLSPLSVSSVINKMHIDDAGVYLKHVTRLVIEMTKGKNNRDWWMGATKKVYTIGWLVGMALQFTMCPPLQALGQAINYVSYGVYGINKIITAVDYAFSAEGLRYTQMAGSAGLVDIDSGLKLQDYYLSESTMAWSELKSVVWELPLMLAGEGIINLAKVRKILRPLTSYADDLSTVEAFQKLDDLTLDYANANRVNKLKRPVLKKMAVMLGDGAVEKVIKNNLEVWMTVDDVTFEIMKKKFAKLNRWEIIKLKTQRIQTVEPFKSMLRGEVFTEVVEQLVFKSMAPGKGFFKGLWHNTVTAGKMVGRGAKNTATKVKDGVQNKVEGIKEGVKTKAYDAGRAMKMMIIKKFGRDGWRRVARGGRIFKDVVNNLYSWAFVKMHFFKHSLWLMNKLNITRWNGYFAFKMKQYLNEGVKRGYISWDQVKTIINKRQINDDVRELYLKYYIDETGKLHQTVAIGAVNPAQRAEVVEQFVNRYVRRSGEMKMFREEVEDYLRKRLNRANLGEDELNVLFERMYNFEIYLKNTSDARLLMDYIRDISRYPGWQKIEALKKVDQLFLPHIREAASKGADLAKLLPPVKYFKRNPVKDFYTRRGEYFEHRDWLFNKMKSDFKFRKTKRFPTDDELKKIAYSRARSVQEMKLGCAARTGSIFRSYAKSSYKGFSMNSGLWITAIGYGFQNYMKDKNAEFYFRFIYDMLMTAFGKYLKNAVMMNTNNTMWGKARSTTMIMAGKDLVDAPLNIILINLVREYIDGTNTDPVPEDVRNDKDFQYGIQAIHDSLVNNYLESDEKIKMLFEKLSKATNVNEVMFALYAKEGQETNIPEADMEIFREIEKYNSGGGDFQEDIFVLLEELEYKSRMELKEYGINSGDAAADRYLAHRIYGVPMAFFSYGLSQGIYYNLCWGIQNPKAAYLTSLIGYYSIASVRSNFYYWWMNETQITQPTPKKEAEAQKNEVQEIGVNSKYDDELEDENEQGWEVEEAESGENFEEDYKY